MPIVPISIEDKGQMLVCPGTKGVLVLRLKQITPPKNVQPTDLFICFPPLIWVRVTVAAG